MAFGEKYFKNFFLVPDNNLNNNFSSVHELKVWSLSSDFHILTAHMVIQDLSLYQKVLKQANKTSKLHGVHKATIQIDVK